MPSLRFGDPPDQSFRVGKIPEATATKQQTKRCSTMVTTRRSSRVEPQYPSDPFHRRKHQRLLEETAEGIRLTGRDTAECFSLLEQVFAQSTRVLWFRILHVDNHEDDICVGTGVAWR